MIFRYEPVCIRRTSRKARLACRLLRHPMSEYVNFSFHSVFKKRLIDTDLRTSVTLRERLGSGAGSLLTMTLWNAYFYFLSLKKCLNRGCTHGDDLSTVGKTNCGGGNCTLLPITRGAPWLIEGKKSELQRIPRKRWNFLTWRPCDWSVTSAVSNWNSNFQWKFTRFWIKRHHEALLTVLVFERVSRLWTQIPNRQNWLAFKV